MMSDFLESQEQPISRPVFITVLCILTFIGSGWGIISEGFKYFTADSQAVSITQTKESLSVGLEKKGKNGTPSVFSEKIVESLNASPKSIRMGALANATSAAFCLIGAFLMWQLKKRGFYFYLAGTVIGIISPFIIFGASNLIAIISSAAFGFFGLIFVILYSVNLRFMK